VYDKEGNKLGVSKVNIRNIQETRCGTWEIIILTFFLKYAAKLAVPSVVLSRVIMTTPGMGNC
jgi:hypothetical protein